jgi:Flp pilus assembly protein TadD
MDQPSTRGSIRYLLAPVRIILLSPLIVAVALAALAAPGAAAAQDPAGTEATAAAADSAWLTGDTDRAERLYGEILEADPAHHTALHRMALLRAWAERYDESLRLFERLLALYPNSVDVRIDRARVLAWRGELEPALAALDSILAEEPTHLDALVGVARTLRWQGREAPALAAARRAVELHPGSPEARSELRAARLPFAPLAAPSVAHESDSDGNRILTAAAVARFRPLAAMGARVDAWVRTAAEVTAADLDHQAHGGTVTGTWHTGAGWTASGTVGASANDVAPRPIPTWGLALASPGALPVSGSLTFRRQAFDATARLMERRVEMTELSASVRTGVAERTALSAAAGSAWLLGRVSGLENRRWSAHVSGSHRVLPPLTIGATARLFGYRDDLNDGYFDPRLLRPGRAPGPLAARPRAGGALRGRGTGDPEGPVRRGPPARRPRGGQRPLVHRRGAGTVRGRPVRQRRPRPPLPRRRPRLQLPRPHRPAVLVLRSEI